MAAVTAPRLITKFLHAGAAAGVPGAEPFLGGVVFGKHSLLTLLRDTPSQGTGRLVVRLSDLAVLRVRAVGADIALQPRQLSVLAEPVGTADSTPVTISFESAAGDGWRFVPEA